MIRRPVAKSPSDAIRILQPLPLKELENYAGNEACTPCHQDIQRTHAKSQHAIAMSRVTADSQGTLFRHPSDVVDPQRKILYRTQVIDNRCVLTAHGAQGAPVVAEAEYSFGSGKHGITYQGKQAGTPVELRLSYYSKVKRWGFSPGQQMRSQRTGIVMETGLIKTQETVEGCFVCHSTVIAKEEDRMIPESVMMGVGCEACHGPGKAHIAAMQRGEKNLHLVNLKKLSGQEISIQLCGQCHRSPVTEDMSDVFNQSQLPRLQGLALSQSSCFKKSNGTLSCLSCHDPHDQTPRPRSFHNAKCQSCHDGATAEHPRCPKAPAGDCVSCHMPEQPVGMPFDLRYPTHLIKVWDKK